MEIGIRIVQLCFQAFVFRKCSCLFCVKFGRSRCISDNGKLWLKIFLMTYCILVPLYSSSNLLCFLLLSLFFFSFFEG